MVVVPQKRLRLRPCTDSPGELLWPADRIPSQRQTPSRQNPHGPVDAMTCLAIGKFRSPGSNATAVALVQRFGAGTSLPGAESPRSRGRDAPVRYSSRVLL